jgi:hypothetical protein
VKSAGADHFGARDCKRETAGISSFPPA